MARRRTSESAVVESRLPHPEDSGGCGSSDAVSSYDDGHAFCFSCNKLVKGDRVSESRPKKKLPIIPDDQIITADLKKRGIRKAICEKYGYGLSTYAIVPGEAPKPVQVAPYFNRQGLLVAQKLRFPDKSFVITGDLKEADGALFGQHLWKVGGRRIVITEGEIDCLSVAQALGGSWPVVSIPNGAPGAAKAIQANLEFLESYETVVLMFDNDEHGRKAAAECVDLFSPGKVAVAQIPLKDPNEMLQAGRSDELKAAAWEAQERRPDGIVNGADTWDLVSKTITMGLSYPWKGLTDILYGIRPKEIVTICAGSGIGKSAYVREIGYLLAMTHGRPIGYIGLEENLGRSALGFMGIHANKPMHLPGFDMPKEERRAIFDATLGTKRFWLYDHFGSMDSDNLLSKLRYMVKGLGVQYIILDHLSIVVSGIDADEDERRAIDRTMTALRSFTEETDVGMFLVSHLKRPDGKPFEEGARPTLGHLRGSQAIVQLSDAVIGIQRNQMAHGQAKDVSFLWTLKNRYAGRTGLSSALLYTHDTGRLTEVDFTMKDDEPVVDPSVFDESQPVVSGAPAF